MKKYLPALLGSICMLQTHAQSIVATANTNNAFPVVVSTKATPVYTDTSDDWLVQKAASFLQQDVQMVSGKTPELTHNINSAYHNIIIIGTCSQSPILQQLIQNKKINIDSIQNKWEAFSIQVIDHPFKNIDRALVITGSDKRGTAYGVFEVSKQMGVSPWYWWADVAVKKKDEIYIKNGIYNYASPSVKYRGIFINDEAPAFAGWSKEKFGGVNHHVYEKIFELLLRLKANYLWPAMWGNAFNDDDTLDAVLANKYGIVMGTSHHEPMLRAQQEWKRYGKGAWNYQTNDSVLNRFWKEGIQHMDHHESIVTIGMRGDGDMPMTEGSNIALLEKIVSTQRNIIATVTGKPASETPQLWALYKEVQDYYDKGMRVPDDVTLLLCDDNWGNIRKLPRLTDAPHKGGYGIYYHFDYVGDPRNYKWINTNQIERTWEQMHLAYEYGVDKIWIVNVGDLKPMEFPISFFLDYAWNISKWNETNLSDYYTEWAAQQFGNKHAQSIGYIIKEYTQYNARRKPELLSADTYSLLNYNEANNVVNDYNRLANEAKKINEQLPAANKDAFFQLVLYPVKASANLNAMYVAVAKNKYYAAANNALANMYADSVKYYYREDSLLADKYNTKMANGKWNHMMDQTHIGYTYWQQPEVNKMPDVVYVKQTINNNVDSLSVFKNKMTLNVNNTIHKDRFYEQDGYISIEAAHYSKAVNKNNMQWKVIPGLGKTVSAVTVFPVTASKQSLPNTPHLEYNIFTKDSGTVALQLYCSTTLDFHNSGGLQFAVSFDEDQPQVINLHDHFDNAAWQKAVADNIIIKTAQLHLSKPGNHVLKFWMIDVAIDLQKIVIDFGGVKPSYLGPPESTFAQ